MDAKTYRKGQLYAMTLQDDIYFDLAGLRMMDYFTKVKVEVGTKTTRTFYKYECHTTIRIIPRADVFVEGVRL